MQLRLFRHYVPLSWILLASLDALFIAFYTYYDAIWSHSGLSEISGFADLIAHTDLLFWLMAAAVMVVTGLYTSHNFARFGMLANRIAVALALMLPFAFIVTPRAYAGTMMPHASEYPLRALLFWFLWVAPSRGAFAAGFELGILKRRILILGSGEQAARIAALAASSQKHSFLPVSFVALPGERPRTRCDRVEHPATDLDWLVELSTRAHASEIVVATDERRGLPVRQLLRCKISGITVTEFLDFWERETRSVDLAALRPSWLFYSDGFRCRMFDAVLKRAFDITVSLAVLVLTLPLQLLTACLIKLESAGPVFYRQERVGRYGRVFTILKFRSMRVDAETDGRAQWASERDPRITRVGAVIRKLRVDELPQLINVLRGDMSFVGPRPERPVFVEQLSQVIPYYAERHWVRPGITGWAQVNYPYGASVEDAQHKLSFDLYYMKNVSIFLDFLILLQTLPVVLSRSGAR